MENVLTSIFDWAHPQDLSMDTVEKFGLVKGVVMQEGDARYTEQETGEVKNVGKMTRDNVIFGAGGLAGIARAGQAVIDIDHHKAGVPKEYKQHKEINSHYPVGHVLDAQAVERDGKMVVEAIMAVHNPHVFKLIKEGKIKGNSVTDYGRGKQCDNKGACEYTGSTYGRNSFMLEEIPAMPGTWVAPITESDIGNTIKPTEHRMASATTTLLKDITAEEFSLTTKENIVSHLKTREISDDMAGDIADFMLANPDAFNEHQIAHMQKTDWETWWEKSGSQAVKIFKLQQQITTLEKEKNKEIDHDAIINWLKTQGYKVAKAEEEKIEQPPVEVKTEPQEEEKPQTTPQTEAPETEDIPETKSVESNEESPESVPTNEAIPEETESTPEPEPEAEHSLKYVKGKSNDKDEVGISTIMGALGALRDTHNSINVWPYNGQIRTYGLETLSKIQNNVQNLIYTLQNDHNISLKMQVRNNKIHFVPR